MKRRVFTIFSALSLAAFVTVVALWVRSYLVFEGIYYVFPHQERPGYRSGFVIPGHGSIHAGFYDGLTAVAPPPQLRGVRYERAQISHGPTSVFGCFELQRQYGNAAGWLVCFPYWPPTTLTAMLPALWLQSWRRSRLRRWRAAHQCCIACGYDLRASKERCPECGTQVRMKAEDGGGREGK